MLSLLIATAGLFNLQSKSSAPIVAPIKFFYGDPIIMMSIDGKPPEEFGLNMMTRRSIVTKTEDAGTDRRLSIDGQSIGVANLEAPAGGVHAVLNAVGLSVLNNMAIGIDYAKNEITFWPGGKLSAEGAKAWILKAQKWQTDSGIWSTEILRRAGSVPIVPITVGERQSLMLLRVGQQGTSFAKAKEPASGVSVEYGPGGNQALVTHVRLGSAVLPWVLYFRGVSYDPEKQIDPTISGTFTTENLFARRVIVDLPGNELYAEQLSSDEQLSMFLSDWFQMPLEVQGEKLTLREMPGTHFFAQLSPIYESEVMEIMGQSSQQIIDAARGASDSNATYLKLLFERVWQGFKVKFKRPDGTVQEATLRPPK